MCTRFVNATDSDNTLTLWVSGVGGGNIYHEGFHFVSSNVKMLSLEYFMKLTFKMIK